MSSVRDFNHPINQIYRQLADQFVHYQDNEFIFTSFIGNETQIGNWNLLNEYNLSQKEQTKLFADYQFSCLCKLESLEYIECPNYDPKASALVEEFKYFRNFISNCYLLRIKVERVINVRENFKDIGAPIKGTHINIFVHRDDILCKTKTAKDGSRTITEVDFENTFLNFGIRDIKINNNIINIIPYSNMYRDVDKYHKFHYGLYVSIIEKHEDEFDDIVKYLLSEPYNTNNIVNELRIIAERGHKDKLINLQSLIQELLKKMD